MSKINLLSFAGRCTCQVCGLLAEAARPKATVCAECARNPEQARALLQARVEGARRRAEVAWLQLNRCVDALTEEEGSRWGRMRQGLEEYHLLTADAETRRKVEGTQRAAEAGDPRVPPALAATWLAYEASYWAGDAARREKLRAEVAQVALDDVLGTLDEAA